MRHIAVVGAGASGLSAGIKAAQSGAKVTILEAGKQAGTKILKTGNGRCNLSNMAIKAGADLKEYNEPDFVRKTAEKLDCLKIREFFEDIGLLTYADLTGKVYPITNSSASVRDCLVKACELLNVEIQTNAKVKSITNNSPFLITLNTGEEIEADRVILACGNSLKVASKAGLKVMSKDFVLGPLCTDSKYTSLMDGLRMRAKVTLLRGGDVIFSEEGEVLFRKYGLSGIVIFNASRFAQYSDLLSLDLLPSLNEEELCIDIKKRIKRYKDRPENSQQSLCEMFCGLLPPQAIGPLLSYCDVDVQGSPEQIVAGEIAFALKNFDLNIACLPGADNAQVTRGGVELSEVNAETLETYSYPGLYLCGEMLNVDGACGGFNLHWAWASGIVAGSSAALS